MARRLRLDSGLVAVPTNLTPKMPIASTALKVLWRKFNLADAAGVQIVSLDVRISQKAAHQPTRFVLHQKTLRRVNIAGLSGRAVVETGQAYTPLG